MLMVAADVDLRSKTQILVEGLLHRCVLLLVLDTQGFAQDVLHKLQGEFM